jgi:predicted DNA-binding transcriptional regulator AlpA
MRNTLAVSASAAPAMPPETVPSAEAVAIVLNELDAARRLSMSPRTLQRLRLNGDGPRYVRLTPGGSRVGYALADLKAWVAERTTGGRR